VPIIMSNNFEEETYRGCVVKIEQEEYTEDYNPRKECENVGTMVCWHRRYTLGDEQPGESPSEYLVGLVPFKLLQRFEFRENRAYNNRCTYGDQKGRLDSPTYDAILEKIEDDKKAFIEKWIAANLEVLELYLYDHSGITMSTGAFSCPWDSGRVGYIYCSLETALHEWGPPYSKAQGWDDTTDYTLKPDGTKRTLREAAGDCLEGEVQTYNDYLTGDIGCMVAEDPDGEVIESCGGYFPDHGVAYGKRWEYPMGEGRAAVDGWHEKLEKEELEAAQKQEKEELEAAHWACRDVETV